MTAFVWHKARLLRPIGPCGIGDALSKFQAPASLAIAGTGPVAKSGPPKLAERRTRVIILTQLNVPKLRFFVGKTRSNTSFCIVPFAGSNKKIEKRNMRRP